MALEENRKRKNQAYSPMSKKRRAVPKSGEKFGVLVVGEMGDGKSSIVKKITKKHHPNKPISDIAESGVTKEICWYPVELGVCECEYAIDTPGVGDEKMSRVIAAIEKALEHIPVHAIVVTCGIPKFRITLGVRIAGCLVKAGIIDNNTQALNSVIIVGTQKDLVKPTKLMKWKKKVVPGFAKVLGGKPRAVVMTGLSLQEDGEGEDDIEELLTQLRQIGKEHILKNTKGLKYKAPDADALVKILSDSTGLDLESKGAMEKMKKALEIERKKMEAKANEKIKKLEDKVEGLRNRPAEVREIHHHHKSGPQCIIC